MCKPKPVETNEMVSFLFLLCCSCIACFSYNHTHVQPKPNVFSSEHRAFTILPQPFKFLVPIPLEYFTHNFPVLVCFDDISEGLLLFFFVHPCPLWVVWPPMSFPVRFALVQLHFFQFDSLCNSPICMLFPLERTF